MLNFIYVLVTGIIVTGINLSALFTASKPSELQTIASAIFLVFWLLFAMYKGLERERGFLKFTTLFWGIGLLLSFVGTIGFFRAIAVASVFIFTGPSYGMFYYVTDGIGGTSYILWAIFVPLLIGIVGYFAGTRIGKVEVMEAKGK